MDFSIDKTIFRHKMWGEGVLRGIEETAVFIEFPNVGLKKLTKSSLQNGILTLINPETTTDNVSEIAKTNNDGALLQCDKSETIIGGKNIMEAFETDDTVVFNESYTVVGDDTTAKKICATYDLTVVGNINVGEINVYGALTVIGNISADVINCANALICQGDVKAKKIFVGSIIAKSIKSTEFFCDGNALVETTIDIDELSKTEKTMVACEGIIGAGCFSALNAIANEYFEFEGNVEGNILELDSEKTLSELTAHTQKGVDLADLPLEEVFDQVKERLQLEFKKCISMDEDSLLELTKSLENNSINNLTEYNYIFSTLIRISYQDVIDDFGDYLTVVFAKRILPDELYRYETLEHIEMIMLPQAEKNLDALDFKPKSVDHIANCIKIAIKCAEYIPMHINKIFDKIFSSFGIRYSTVKDILDNSVFDTTSIDKSAMNVPFKTDTTESDSDMIEDMFDVEGSKPKKLKASKRKFLALSIQEEARFFGITVDEQMRLASARIKTCGEFLQMTEREIIDIFKKKSFLANHLLQAQQKMRNAVDELSDE